MPYQDTLPGFPTKGGGASWMQIVAIAKVRDSQGFRNGV